LEYWVLGEKGELKVFW